MNIKPLRGINERKDDQPAWRFLTLDKEGFVAITPENIELLMDKINEVVEEINLIKNKGLATL